MTSDVLLGQGPGPKPEADQSFAAMVVYLVAAATRMDPRDIYTAARSSAPAARARQIAMYLAHTGLNWTQERTGRAFGRDRSTVGHACSKVEDQREDPRFDARVTALEAWLRKLPPQGAPL